MKIPKILSESTVYQNPRLNVKRLKLQFGNKFPVEWEIPEVADGVNIVPILPDNKVILVREWRPAWKQIILQIPAGKCTSGDETKQLKQAHLELREEIGMDAKTIKKIISFGSAAGIRQKANVFLATGLYSSPIKKRPEDEHEYVDTVTIPLQEALDLFISGREFTTSYTIIGLLLAQQFLLKNRTY